MKKEIQMFLLPFAGGSSLSFLKLTRLLDQRIEAITVEYAGRGSRKEESFINEYDIFLNDVVSYISCRREKDIPYALFGYSLGSALSFDICCRGILNKRPVYSFFCAEGSLLKANPARKFSLLSDKEFMDKMLMLGGLDERILKNKTVLEMYMEIIKKDYDILSQFDYKFEKAQCDASVIYSNSDFICVNMQDWEKIIDGYVDYYTMGDNHFFINQRYKEVADIINEKLVSYVERYNNV